MRRPPLRASEDDSDTTSPTSSSPTVRGWGGSTMGGGRLDGQVALVTGGGTGIGRACALRLAAEGATVAVNYSQSESDAHATVAEVRARGGRALAVRADVAVDAEVRAMVRAVVDAFGRLDVLVNNAATTKFIAHDQLDALTDDVWDRTMAVNLKGPWLCTRAAAPIMKRQGRGTVVNITSIAGLTGYGSSVAYCASKAGVNTLTRSLARALAPEIRVNAVAPGFVETRWTAGQAEAAARHRAATPLRRNGTPDDVAEVVLATVVASWMTGQVVAVDGGRSLM